MRYSRLRKERKEHRSRVEWLTGRRLLMVHTRSWFERHTDRALGRPGRMSRSCMRHSLIHLNVKRE